MQCPKCGKPRFMVTNSRQRDADEEIYIARERRCEDCGHREEWRERKEKVLSPVPSKQ